MRSPSGKLFGFVRTRDLRTQSGENIADVALQSG
jgi:hypothetical protein